MTELEATKRLYRALEVRGLLSAETRQHFAREFQLLKEKELQDYQNAQEEKPETC